MFGFIGIDLVEVGAHRVGDPAGRDPRALWVHFLESDLDAGRRILPRLGADANRRDAALFDGAWTVLEVSRITSSGFDCRLAQQDAVDPLPGLLLCHVRAVQPP